MPLIDPGKKAPAFSLKDQKGETHRLSDYDGRRPDWGRHKIDFSTLPPEWVDLFRRGTDLELEWLTTLAARTRAFKKKIP